MADPYIDPRTGVLRNRLGITDAGDGAAGGPWPAGGPDRGAVGGPGLHSSGKRRVAAR